MKNIFRTIKLLGFFLQRLNNSNKVWENRTFQKEPISFREFNQNYIHQAYFFIFCNYPVHLIS